MTPDLPALIAWYRANPRAWSLDGDLAIGLAIGDLRAKDERTRTGAKLRAECKATQERLEQVRQIEQRREGARSEGA